jgi:hypothetical protein
MFCLCAFTTIGSETNIATRIQEGQNGKAVLRIVAGSPMLMDGTTNNFERFHNRVVSFRVNGVTGGEAMTNEMVFGWFVDLVLEGQMLRGGDLLMGDPYLGAVVYRGDELYAYRFLRGDGTNSLPALPVASYASKNLEANSLRPIPEKIRDELRNIMSAKIEKVDDVEMHIIVKSTTAVESNRRLVYSFQTKEWRLKPEPDKPSARNSSL